MRFKELLEYRRNPDLNAKFKSGFEEAILYLKSMGVTENDSFGWGVTMTELPKVGINPKSAFDTPIGVYYYPASYFIKTKRMNAALPFRDRAKYINIIKFNTNRAIEDIGELDSNTADSYMEKVKDYVHPYMNASDIEETISDAREESEMNGGRMFWYATNKFSGMITDKSWRASKYVMRSVTWNKMLRNMNITCIQDLGNSIIHENEPTQGVILDPRIIESVKTISNYNRFKNIDSMSGSQMLTLARQRGKRIKPFEDKLLSDEGYYNSAIAYADSVIKGKWPELEQKLVDSGDMALIEYYCMRLRLTSLPQWESVFAKNSDMAYHYASNITHQRFIAGERAIAKAKGNNMRWYCDEFDIEPEDLVTGKKK